MKKLHLIAVTVLSAVLVFGMTTAAFAANYTDPIKKVELELNYDLHTGMTKEDIEVSCDTDGVSSVSISNIANTTYGKRPTITLKVKADTSDGYYFDSSDAGRFKSAAGFSLSGDDAEYKSSKRGSNSSVTVALRLPKIGGDDNSGLEVPSVSWDVDTGVVSWEEAEDADKYSVKLLRGSSTKKTVTTTGTSYDFSGDLNSYGTGYYTVRVKAYAGNYSGEWEESEELEVDDENKGTFRGNGSGGSSGGSSYSGGAWLRDNVGWWYCNPDGSYTRNNWQKINGGWYFFNASGYMVTGWLRDPRTGLWYYLSEANDSSLGRMVTSSYINGYYVNADGVWVQ